MIRSLKRIALLVMLTRLYLFHKAGGFFFQHLSSLHLSLQFNMELENNMLSFLDGLVERYVNSFLASIYRNPRLLNAISVGAFGSSA